MEQTIEDYITQHTQRFCADCMWPKLRQSNELFIKLTSQSEDSNPVRQHDLEQVKRTLYNRAIASAPLGSVAFSCDNGHGSNTISKRAREDDADRHNVEDLSGKRIKTSSLTDFDLPILRKDAVPPKSTNSATERPASAYLESHNNQVTKQVQTTKVTSAGSESMGARLEAFVQNQVQEEMREEKLRWQKEQTQRESAVFLRETAVAQREEEVERRTKEADEKEQIVKALRISLEGFEETLMKRKKDITEQQKKLTEERERVKTEMIRSLNRIL
jgi:hypothetical protein